MDRQKIQQQAQVLRNKRFARVSGPQIQHGSVRLPTPIPLKKPSILTAPNQLALKKAEFLLNQKIQLDNLKKPAETPAPAPTPAKAAPPPPKPRQRQPQPCGSCRRKLGGK